MIYTFPPQAVTLSGAGTLFSGALTWSGPDFAPRFNESIIKRSISLRLTCTSNITLYGVYVGVRYATLTKEYQVAERKTIGYVPPGGSVELSAASIPALAALNSDITSITVELTSQISGVVTVSLNIDDDTPPLTGVLEYTGLDARFAEDFVPIVRSGLVQVNAGTFSQILRQYTVPTGKRCYIALITTTMEPTGSYPGTCNVTLQFTISGITASMHDYSRTDQYVTTQFVTDNIPTLTENDTIIIAAQNLDTTNHFFEYTLIGKEVF